MGAEFKFHGVKEADIAMGVVVAHAPQMLAVILNETGAFGTRETKLHTRVDTGTARASIGQFTPNDMTAKAKPEDVSAAKAAAYSKDATVGDLEVAWGSRLVYVPVLNYKLGDYMFEKGLQAAISFFPVLCAQYLPDLFHGLGK